MKYSAMAFETFGAPDVFSKMDLSLPKPNNSQVIVQVEASSVNFADVMARRGNYPASGPPYVTGVDFVGRVIEAVSDSGLALVGKRVLGFGDTGSYATLVLANIDLIFEIPEEMPLDTAAACPLLTATTYALLGRNQGLQPGDNLVIHAAGGGIGLTAIQMARQLGAATIFALVSSRAKASAVLNQGATHVVVTNETPNYPEIIRSQIPEGVELILNSVAGDTIQQDLEILKPGGQIVVFGMASGKPGVAKSDQLHHSSRTLSGFSYGYLRRTNPEAARKIMEQALPFVTSGIITFDEVTRYSLWDVAQAHRDLESRTTIGKLILVP
ncbi:MAG: zinc-binding dehydrogenase [Acidimicrobiaceae bacterium]|nr:zinc-binding dehydrogenase [Acidimicrobiaceae bacterium]